MNQKVRIFSVIFLTAIYVNAIGIVFNFNNCNNFNYNNSNTNLHFIQDFSSSFITHNSHSINYLNNFNNERLPNSENMFSGLGLNLSLNEKLIETDFKRYIIFSKNNLIKYRKSDFIFPFHYFW